MNHSPKSHSLSTRLWNLFTSMRTGLALLLCISCLLSAATFLQTTGPTGIYSSLWFRVLVGVFCMNLIICSTSRVRKLKFTPSQPFDVASLPLSTSKEVNVDKHTLERQLYKFFRPRRFKVDQMHGGKLYHISRGRLYPWFSLLLHLSLVKGPHL